MTFAEWQASRDITPWTTVHNWSEFAWRLKLLALNLGVLALRFAEAYEPVIRQTTEVMNQWYWTYRRVLS